MADYTAYGTATGPATGNPDSSVTLGIEFYVTSTAWLKGMRFWRPTIATDGDIQGAFFTVTTSTTGSTVLGTIKSFPLSGIGWQTVLLDSLVPATIGQRYRMGVLFPNGGYPATANYFSSGPGASDIVNGPLTVPTIANSTGGDHQNQYDYGALIQFPGNGVGSGPAYWVDPIITDVAAHPEAAAGFISFFTSP